MLKRGRTEPKPLADIRPQPTSVHLYSELYEWTHVDHLTIWFKVCCWPHTQRSDEARPHLCRLYIQRCMAGTAVKYERNVSFAQNHIAVMEGWGTLVCQCCGPQILTQTLTVAFDQLRVVASSTSNDLGLRSVSTNRQASVFFHLLQPCSSRMARRTLPVSGRRSASVGFYWKLQRTHLLSPTGEHTLR